MKSRISHLSAFACLNFFALSSGSSWAQVMDLTSTGSAILGVDYSGNYSQLGTPFFHSGGPSNLTDNNQDGTKNLGSSADTFVDPNPNNSYIGNDDSSYIGFTFATPTTLAVTSLTVNFRLFGDGGWFGENNTNGTNPLLPVLIEPTLQVTTDQTTWTTVTDSSNYLTVVGTDNPGAGSTDTVTFTLAAPEASIEGIRITGLSGGTAGQQHGFIGVADERVFGETDIPEPSTYALIALGGLLLLATGKFWKLAPLS